MANIKSAKKRAKQTVARHARNKSRISAIKTAVKKVLVALDKGEEINKVREYLKDAEQKIARAKGKRVLHRNTASRKVSMLAKRVAHAARA